MKKLLSGLVLALTFALIVGCGNQGASNDASGNSDKGTDNGEKVELSVYETISDPIAKEIFNEIVAEFEKENPNIKVETNFPGQEYENLLKVKMAANDMPDLFDTHGWSKIRYGDYLADLSDQEWTSDLSPSIEGVVSDENGKVYTLPLNEAKEGITYNADLLEKYGVKPPRTFDELLAAAEKIKDESNGEVTPFYFSAPDAWTIGQYFDFFATPLLISDEDHNYGDELKNGSFDWSKWTYLPEKFKEMQDKGLMNKDVLTAKYSDAPRLFAQEKIAFTTFMGAFAAEVNKLNSDIEVGLMPIPAIHEGDEPTFVGGERYTLGAWKDSEHLEEAKQLIAHFAKPENVKKMAEATGLPAGLTNAKAENIFAEYYEQYSDNRVYPYFDRVYLPNGMWDVMSTTGQEVLAGTKTPEQVTETMKKEYERLRSQQ